MRMTIKPDQQPYYLFVVIDEIEVDLDYDSNAAVACRSRDDIIKRALECLDEGQGFEVMQRSNEGLQNITSAIIYAAAELYGQREFKFGCETHPDDMPGWFKEQPKPLRNYEEDYADAVREAGELSRHEQSY